jgi:V/A-type H+-transporting ATPase subunit K
VYFEVVLPERIVRLAGFGICPAGAPHRGTSVALLYRGLRQDLVQIEKSDMKGPDIMDRPERKLKQQVTQSVVMLLTVMAILTTLFCTQAFGANPNEEEIVPQESRSGEHVKYGLIAAAAAFGLGAIGAGIAIAHVGAAAMGAVAEKPQIAGQALIFVALAEGLVVFVFITALMILGKV